jgi:Kef-type K+ transport system membrane component KefB
MHGVFAELSLVIVITAAVSLVMKLLRQPLILGYILAGLLVGPSVFGLIHSVDWPWDER